MKTIILSLVLILLCAVIWLMPEKHECPEHVTINRVSDSIVSLECNDEREPVVTKFENSTHITVTCKEVQ